MKAAVLLGALLTGCAGVGGASAGGYSATLESQDILLIEKMSLGNEPEANRRWRLESSGAVYFAKNRAPVPSGTLWNVPFPTAPLTRLNETQLSSLKALIEDGGVWSLSSSVNPAVEDGMRLALTLRKGDQQRTITCDNSHLPPVDKVVAAFMGMVSPGP